MRGELSFRNLLAWRIWTTYAEDLIEVQSTVAGSFFTLNLAAFQFAARVLDLPERELGPIHSRLRAIFSSFQEVQKQETGPKTKAAMARTRALKKGSGSG